MDDAHSLEAVAKRQGETSSQETDARDEMVFVPGGTFRMGSDNHYPEEAPTHRVTVDDFWIDRTPVTNRAVPSVRRSHRLCDVR